jgi:AcrR family transcriptional regulator
LRKGDATRARILEEAARQAAVSLSKSGLFKHFDDKEAMQLAILEQALDQFVDFVWRPAEPLPMGRERVEKVFDRWLDWSELEWPDGGCPLVSFSTELDDQPGALRDLLQARLQRWRRTLTRELGAAAGPQVTPETLDQAYFQMKSYILGHGEMRRLMEDRGARETARSAFADLLDRLAARH